LPVFFRPQEEFRATGLFDKLRANVLEAVALHFEDAATRPRLVQMHYMKDELLAVEAAPDSRIASPSHEVGSSKYE
jgi:hypothetical protein